MGVRLSEECNWRVVEGEDDEGEREERVKGEKVMKGWWVIKQITK